MILRIEQAKVARINVPLHAQTAEEPHIGPELPTPQRLHLDSPTTRDFHRIEGDDSRSV